MVEYEYLWSPQQKLNSKVRQNYPSLVSKWVQRPWLKVKLAKAKQTIWSKCGKVELKALLLCHTNWHKPKSIKKTLCKSSNQLWSSGWGNAYCSLFGVSRRGTSMIEKKSMIPSCALWWRQTTQGVFCVRHHLFLLLGLLWRLLLEAGTADSSGWMQYLQMGCCLCFQQTVCGDAQCP